MNKRFISLFLTLLVSAAIPAAGQQNPSQTKSDGFTPSEKITAESAVSFPVDI